MNYRDMLTATKRIVVVGDAIIDRWVYGAVAPCQDGCDKFAIESVVSTSGGAANAAECLQHWPVRVRLFSFEPMSRPVKTRYICDGVRFRADDERFHGATPFVPKEHDEILETVDSADGVLLSDYDKGFLSQELVCRIVDRCRARGIPCVADAKRYPGFYYGAIVKGNHEYWAKYSSVNVQVAIKTNGAEPPAVLEKYFKRLRSELLSVPCVNHVGAGDCFGAHLLLALTHGFSLEDSARFAHSAGRVYVQHPRNRAPTPGEVLNDLSSGPAQRLA